MAEKEHKKGAHEHHAEHHIEHHAEHHKHIHKKEAHKAGKFSVSSIKKVFSKKNLPAVGAVIAIIVIALLILNIDKLFGGNKVLAVVNGEKITEKELNELFPAQLVPATLTQKMLVNETINLKLLLQEAEKQKIKVTDKQVDDFITSSLSASGMTEDEFEKTIKQQNLTKDFIKSNYKIRMTVSLLINKTVTSKIEITDAQIKEYYDANKDFFKSQNQTLADVKEQIYQFLLLDQQRVALNEYIEQLRQKADIKIYQQNIKTLPATGVTPTTSTTTTVEGWTFEGTGDEICRINGKPVIRLFSTTSCPHCNWIKDTFDETIKGYGDKIVAYHWELDTGDNTLTEEAETEVPASEEAVYSKYSSGAVPTFVFGCKYARIGNGYESSRDLEAEKKEFKEVIDKLLE